MDADTTITDSERDMLRFPAIADVLRFGTPVRGINPDRPYKGQAVILSVDPNRGEARVAYARDLFPPEWVSLDDIAINLADDDGRAHLAWWIAVRIGGAEAMRGDLPLPQWAADFPGWSIYCGEAGTLMGATWEAFCHPLDALDPDDPRLLPDGSRLVDALALSLVGRHLLAGGGR